MSKIKLEIACQNLRGLNRRAKATKQAMQNDYDRVDRIDEEVKKLADKRAAALAAVDTSRANLQGIEEFREEVLATVRRLFWEQHPEAVDLDAAEKHQVFHEYLVSCKLD